MLKRLGAGLAGACVLIAAASAHATAVVRIEFVRATPSSFQWGQAVNQPFELDAPPQMLSVTGSTAQVSTAAPTFGPSSAPSYTGFARVIVVSGVADCVAGAAPNPAVSGANRIAAGAEVWLAVASGNTVACIEDVNGATPAQDDGAGDLAGIRSNTGATATSAAAAKSDLDTIAANTTGAATAANQVTGNGSLSSIATSASGAKSDLDTVVTQTSGLAKETGGNLAAAKSDLDTIVTNTTGAATAANQTATQANAGSSASKATAVQGLANGLPVATTAQAATSTLSAVTLTTAGTFQTVLSSGRKSCRIQNTSTDLEYLFLGSGTASASSSLQLLPGQVFSCADSGVVITDTIQMASAKLNGATAVAIQQ